MQNPYKRIAPLFVVLALGLAACAGQPTPTARPTSAPTNVPV